MRVACVLIPHFAVQIEVRRCPDLQGKPVVLVHSKGSRRFIYDASPRASGVSPGMALSTALGRCKEAVLLDANLPLYQTASKVLLDALSRVSPVVEDSAPGLAYVDVHGLLEMYGGETRMVTALLQAVPNGFAPQVGIGDGKFPAYIAATHAHYHGAAQGTEEPSSYLANVSVGMLPVPFKTIKRLQGFGLTSLGQVAAVGVGPMQAQFGHEGRFMWGLSVGRDTRLIVPRQNQETVMEYLEFPGPSATLPSLLLAVEVLLGRIFSLAHMRGRYVRSVTLEGDGEMTSSWQKSVSFRDAIGSKERIFTVLEGALDSVVLPHPLIGLRLTLGGITGESGQQGSLFAEVRQRDRLKTTMAQMEERLGTRPPVYVVREVEPWSRIPERRHALIPFAP
ncbi:MAG: DNA polymerase Y family protein [Chloroflexi bacterium]|nr:DNA polymerase Y family protein [Chloroflexota bacterium]